MEFLEKAILEKGKVLDGDILKVGSFFNQLMDISILEKIGKNIYQRFKDKNVTKILTVEASGIAMAVATALCFKCDVVFAKKSKTKNVEGEVYTADCYSFTHKTLNQLIVPKEYINSSDNVLIIDDFLATGEALNSLMDIVSQAKAKTVGIGIGIEKGFQKGGDKLREQGVDLFSLAVIDKMDTNGITFRK